MNINSLNSVQNFSSLKISKENNISSNTNTQTNKPIETQLKQMVYAQQFLKNYAIKKNISSFCGNVTNITDIQNQIQLPKINIEELLNDSVYIFENPKFYKYFEENKEKMIKNIQAMYDIIAWGKTKERKIIPEFVENVSEKHIALLCDPGIVSRLDDFYNFIKQFPNDINELTPFELRKSFSDFLGTQKYYRGIILTEEEKKEMQQNGIRPNNFKGKNAAKITEDIMLDYKKSYKRFIDDKINGYNRNNPLISVSQIRNCAEKIPLMYNLQNGDKKLYIFELELPKINVIEPKGEFEVQYPGLGFFDKDNNPIPKEKVESFVPFFISSNNIVGVSECSSSDA